MFLLTLLARVLMRWGWVLRNVWEISRGEEGEGGGESLVWWNARGLQPSSSMISLESMLGYVHSAILSLCSYLIQLFTLSTSFIVHRCHQSIHSSWCVVQPAHVSIYLPHSFFHIEQFAMYFIIISLCHPYICAHITIVLPHPMRSTSHLLQLYA